MPRYGLCEHHHGKPSKQWSHITRLILSESDRAKALKIMDAINALGDSDYKPHTGERIDGWMNRVSHTLKEQVNSNKNKEVCHRQLNKAHQILAGKNHA